MLIESNLKYYKRIIKRFETENELNDFLNTSSNFVKVGIEDAFPFGNIGESSKKFTLSYYDTSKPLEPNVDFVKGSRQFINEKLIEKYNPTHRTTGQEYDIGFIFYLTNKDYKEQLENIKGNGPSLLFHLRVTKEDSVVFKNEGFPFITLVVDAIDVVIDE